MYIEFVLQGLNQKYREDQDLKEELERVLKNCIQEEIEEQTKENQKRKKALEKVSETYSDQRIIKYMINKLESFDLTFDFDSFELMYEDLPEACDNLRLVIRVKAEQVVPVEVYKVLEILKDSFKKRIFRVKLTLEEVFDQKGDLEEQKNLFPMDIKVEK